jgi:hypothetical protein
VCTCVFVGYVNFVVHDFVCVIIPGRCLNSRVYAGRLFRGSNFVSPANVSFIFMQDNLVSRK